MRTASLYTKINSLPVELKIEANDFIDFLMSKKNSIKTKKSPKAGFLKGKFEIMPDFDEPLEDFNKLK